MFVVTRAISTTGGYPLEDYAPELDMPKGAQLVDGPVEARKAAREQLSNGADWLKVYMTHRSWVDAQGKLVSQPTLTVEELKAVVDEAHGWGRKVACHAYGGIGLHRALDGGCDSIEHGLDLDDAAVAQMVRQGTWLCPTMSVYYKEWSPEGTAAGIRDRARAAVHGPSLRKAWKAGVKIVFGTDVGGFPWNEPIAEEFARMVEFGMPPMAAIQAATSKAAEMLDMSGKLGVAGAGRLRGRRGRPGRPAVGRLDPQERLLRDEGRAGLQGREATVGAGLAPARGRPRGRRYVVRRFRRSRNSSRTDCVLKIPRIAEVTVSAPGFLMPRISTQRCRASMTTMTPWGSSFSAM